MANHRPKPGETPEQAKARYNAEMRDYRAKRKAEGKPLASSYDYAVFKTRDVQKKYGVPLATVLATLEEQGGKCAICSQSLSLDPTIATGRIDHCHASGKFRGVLCDSCNLGLGKFGDDPKRLLAAVAYLAK